MATKLVISTSIDADLVALQAGKKIVVHQLVLTAAAANNVKFTSGTGPTDITGLFHFLAAGDNNKLVLPWSDDGWFETAAGEKLSIDVSAAQLVAGVLAYTKE